jgi:hypothetical protein
VIGRASSIAAIAQALEARKRIADALNLGHYETVVVHDAKTHFSRRLDRTEGEEFVIGMAETGVWG